MKTFNPALVVAALLASVIAAEAQGRPGRPYRGLFGSGVSDAEQVLTVSGSMGAGYDTSVLAAAGEATPLGGAAISISDPDNPDRSSSGSYAIFNGSLSYSQSRPVGRPMRGGERRTLALGASVSSSTRYYPTFDGKFTSTYSGSLGGSMRLSQRTTFGGDQTISYQPYTLRSLFPGLGDIELGQVVAPDQDFSSLHRAYYYYSTGANMTHELSRRSTLGGTYSSSFTSGDREENRFHSQSGSLRFTRSLSRNLNLRIGYGYTQGSYGEDHIVRSHLIDSGLDYSKALTVSRKTTVSFSSGAVATTDRSTTSYNAIGSATLAHEINRTWRAMLAYNRNVSFVETFSTPVSSDGVTASLSGLLGRRISTTSSVGGSFGQVGLGVAGAGQNGFATYFATTGISTALSRNLALSVDYAYYRYSFDSAVLLPRNFSQELSRHGVHAYLSAWAPLLYRARRR